MCVTVYIRTYEGLSRYCLWVSQSTFMCTEDGPGQTPHRKKIYLDRNNPTPSILSYLRPVLSLTLRQRTPTFPRSQVSCTRSRTWIKEKRRSTGMERQPEKDFESEDGAWVGPRDRSETRWTRSPTVCTLVPSSLSE